MCSVPVTAELTTTRGRQRAGTSHHHCAPRTHIPCRSKHHVVCSLHAVTLNDTCPADAMLLVTMVS